MKYVALLRGINVGGKNKVEMARLKQVFEELGFSDVSTYINSGNVIFSSDKIALVEAIEKLIESTFGLSIKTVVRSQTQIAEIDKITPTNWANDSDFKTDVMFLWDEINSGDIMNQLVIKPGIDTVKYVDGALIWHVSKKLVTRSGLMRVAGSELYKHMTIRNINTLRKLSALMKD